MSIECYYSECRYHSSHTDSGLGPFCDEHECRANPADLAVLQISKYGYRACDNPKCDLNKLPFARGSATVTVVTPATGLKKTVARYEYRLGNGGTVYFCEACHNAVQMVIVC